MKAFYEKHKKPILIIGGTIVLAFVVAVIFNGDTSAIRVN